MRDWVSACRQFLALCLAAFGVAATHAGEIAVGFERIHVPIDADLVADGGIWYPSVGSARPHRVGMRLLDVVPSGPIQGQALGLIVISHGSSGHFTGHFDTAAALARAGFVVAAINHPGDNALDESLQGTRALLESRPRHLWKVIDFATRDWRGAPQIDSERIGAFGFSAGGHSVLVAAGMKPEYIRLTGHCKEFPQEPLCQILGGRTSELEAAVAPDPDPRIRAVAVAAPAMAFVFEPGTTNVPLQLWAASEDEWVSYETNFRSMFAKPDPLLHLNVVQGAGHFAFLPPCPKDSEQVGAKTLPTCMDPAGFDRKKFEDQFHRELVKHFLGNLPQR